LFNFHRIENLSRSEAEHQLIIDLLSTFADIFEDNTRTSAERKKLLTEILKYLQNKRSSKTTKVADEIEYIRYVRNSLAHRKSIPVEAIRVAIPMFWRMVREISGEWDSSEISNLLSYGLKMKNSISSSASISLKTKLRKYEELFYNKNEFEQIDAFRNILLSIYETEEFQRYMKKNRTSRPNERSYD